MVNIIHRIGIKASPNKVYEALSTTNGISSWWTKDTSGISEIGQNIVVTFRTPEDNEVGNMTIEVLDLKKDQTVHWKFITGPEEWIGTEVVFDIRQEEAYTIVIFNHINWAEEVEFKAHCSMKWATFMLSLKNLIETGTGNPSPFDVKIDNWN